MHEYFTRTISFVRPTLVLTRRWYLQPLLKLDTGSGRQSRLCVLHGALVYGSANFVPLLTTRWSVCQHEL